MNHTLVTLTQAEPGGASAVPAAGSLPRLRADLRAVTARLAAELTRPTREPPAWSPREWRLAMAVATLQGIAALLEGSLLWQGPELWQRFLREQADHTRRRYDRIGQLLSDLDERARQASLAIMALKGAALRSRGLYPRGERPTGDIDLLVHPGDLAAASALLQDFGYVLCQTMSRHQVYAPPGRATAPGFGEHIDHPIKIELHTRIAEKLPVSEVDITQPVFPLQPHSGVNGYPSIAALMLHLLLHAAGNIRSRALRMIQVHDIALLSPGMTSHDWQELLDRDEAGDNRWWAYAPLLLVSRCYPDAIPAEVLATLAQRCPWLLRTVACQHELADVSWSNLRIAAFPGIEWSRTPWEALRFIKSRVLPTRTDLAVLKYVAASDPASRRTPWYGLSHGTRILRWLVSQPPRIQAMYAVHLAMAYGGQESQHERASDNCHTIRIQPEFSTSAGPRV
jgi:hypothetical protein